MAVLTVNEGQTFDSRSFALTGDDIVATSPVFEMGDFWLHFWHRGTFQSAGEAVTSDTITLPKRSYGDDLSGSSYVGGDGYQESDGADFDLYDVHGNHVATIEGVIYRYVLVEEYFRTGTFRSWEHELDIDMGSWLERNDVVTLASGNDWFQDPDGQLTLWAGAGNDTIYAWDAGHDGAGGADRIWGEAGNDVVGFSSRGSTVWGGEGNDHLSAALSAEGSTLHGGEGDDILTARAADSVVNGDEGLDVIHLEGANSTADGGGGDDRIDVSGDASLADGGAGNDRIDAIGAARSTLRGGEGDDVIIAMIGGYVIEGGNGQDMIFATAEGEGDDTWNNDDTIHGGEGNDTIVAGSVGSQVFGDAGDDTIIAKASAHASYFSGGAGDDQIVGEASDWSSVFTGGAGRDTIVTHSNGSSVHGGNDDDAITFSGLGVAVYGDAGNDVIVMEPGASSGAIVWGGSGSDRVEVGAARVFESAGSGDDRYVGVAGLSILTFANGTAGVAIDEALFGTVQDLGPYGRDTITGFTMIRGSQGNDRIGGAGSDNTFWGEDGDDVLSGGGGADALFGDDGDDVLIGGAGADALTGGAGTDTASYATASAAVSVALDGLNPNAGDATGDRFETIENLEGSRFGDTLRGDGGTNVLRGGAGNDLLDGAGGADRILGGAGRDRMAGGEGADVFVFLSRSDSLRSARDVIGDFSEADGDRIDLSAIDARPGGANNAFRFVEGGFTAAGQIRVVQSGGDTHVLVNLDGDRTAEMAVQITGLHALGADDFVL